MATKSDDDLRDAFAFSMQTIMDREAKKLFTGNWLSFDEDNWPVPPNQQGRQTIDLDNSEYHVVEERKGLKGGSGP